MRAVVRTLRGVFRIIASATVLVGATVLVVGLWWVPLKFRGIRLSAWFFTWGTRLLMPSLGLFFQCDDIEQVVNHRGFIFANHTSFFDTLVLSYVLPMRYVAKAGVEKWPFIGWIAVATGTMFVNRNDKAARATVRQTLAERILENSYPPVVIFPEGTRNADEELLPFRYGVFNIAREASIPYLLCAIMYDRPEVVTWQSRHESLLTTVSRIVFHDGCRVRLIPLEVIHPTPSDSVEALAAEARQIVGDGLKAAKAN